MMFALNSEKDIDEMKSRVKDLLGNFGLELNCEKTRIVVNPTVKKLE